MTVPVTINARFRKQALTGVQRFAGEVADLLAADPQTETKEVIPTSLATGMKGHAWEQFALPRAVGKTILFSPSNTGPLAIKRQMVVIHDAAVWDQPDGFTKSFRALYQWLLPKLARRCQVATVSEFSRERLAHHLNISDTRITVLGNAIGPAFKPPAVPTSDEQPYVLCVGSLDPRKNFTRLIEAWNQVCERGVVGQNIELRIAGSANPRTFSDLQLPVAGDRVKWLGKVDDEELIRLYQHARAFIFPSLYEGFGIPPLEAMACGCPVVLSDAASLPEVGGPGFEATDSNSPGAVLYFDPQDAESIANRIEELLTMDSRQRDRLTENAILRAQQFSWQMISAKVHQSLMDHFC